MKPTDRSRALLSVNDVAKILGCSAANVYALIESGELVYIRIGKQKGYRIKAEDLEAFIDARRVQQDAITKRNLPRSRLRHLRL